MPSIRSLPEKWLSFKFQCFVLVLLAIPLSDSNATTQADGTRLASWPSNWTNPVTGVSGGSVTVTVDWGAFSLGCADTASLPRHERYLAAPSQKQHLGIDLRAPLGTRIYSIGRGVIINAGELYGAGENGVVLVEHVAPSGDAFTAVYAHIDIGINTNTQTPWRQGNSVGPGDILGTSANHYGGPHLHFGVGPGRHDRLPGRSDPRIVDGKCVGNPGSTVDPIPFLEGLKVFQGPNACTNLISRNAAVPSGYGSPVNLFANDRNLLFEAVCRGGDKVEILAGHNYPQQYTYRYGYRWTGQQWQRFAFTGSTRQGEWLVGRATAALDRRQLNANGNNWIVGYSCWRQPTGQWRCGCADTACTRGVWQAQGFVLGPQSAAVASWSTVAGTWRGNVQQAGAPRYSTTFTVDASGSGARCGTIAYPELRCGGELRNCRINNGTYRFTEILTSGRLQCADNGTISVQPRGNELDWRWTDSSGRLRATAVLSRQ